MNVRSAIRLNAVLAIVAALVPAPWVVALAQLAVTGFILHALASTESRHLEKTRILQAILDSMSDGVVVANQRGEFTLFNPAATRILGLGSVEDSPDEWSRVYGLYLPDGLTQCLPQDLPLVRAVRGETASEMELVLRHPRLPEPHVISVNACPVRDDSGAVHGGVAVFRDVTAHKRAEAELKALTASLEARVRERTAELEATNRELEAFCYSVSHDLRTPLRAIDGFSQALIEDCADKLGDEGQDHLRRVRSASQRMGQLIDDLLKLSRTTRAELRRESVDLTALVRTVVGELQRNQPDREIRIEIGDVPPPRGDSPLLRVLLENLLGNAWKFTTRCPDPRIEFGCVVEDEQVVYFVRDNGAGFDQTYAHKLFGAFQRLHSASEFPGTGIGLAIVGRIVHRHGGQIRAEGTPGRGAAFYFTLDPG